ncbi:MAG: 3-oxoacyl-[acyl-carrier-protein] reductase [Chloroflexi bacterium]|nr:3-oxoacyl-[acyl-carrier-protein] reductase [Chloroflexota bacterium]
MGELDGQVAVVTGSSRGIGRAIALELGARGCRVVINYHHNEAAAQEVATLVREAGSEAVTQAADICVSEQAQQLIDSAVTNFGGLDILVNNAGITRDGLSMRMSEEDWDAVLDTNLKSAFHCCKAAQRIMLRKRYGRIVNIGSVAGLVGNAGQINYASAKAGLVGLTKSLARELASRSITVNLVAPGYVSTEMTAKLPQELMQKILANIPLQRLAQPEEIAMAVAFLASPGAGYITGQVLTVDGGISM